MTGVLDSELALDNDDEERDDELDGEAPLSDVFVCDVTDDTGVCGDTFDTQGKLNQHRWQKHRLKKEVETKRSKRRGGRGKSSARSAGTAIPQPSTVDRADAYAASIAMFGLGAYLSPVPFDDYDLGVLTAGAPKLGAALDTLAQRNQVVRQACDLILGGGTGGAYIELLLAVLAISAPIAAHHGAIPQDVGDRFGTMIGVAVVPPAQPATPPPVSTFEPVADVDNSALSFIDPKPPSNDLNDRVMTGANAVVVPVEEQLNDGTSEPGPEQPNPEPQPEPRATVHA